MFEAYYRSQIRANLELLKNVHEHVLMTTKEEGLSSQTMSVWVLALLQGKRGIPKRIPFLAKTQRSIWLREICEQFDQLLKGKP